MQKTVTIDGKQFTIRALTWGEKKALQEEFANETGGGNASDEQVERTLSLGLVDKVHLDELDTWAVYSLYREIFKFSFLGPDEAKNSDGPQTSRPTDNSTTAGNADKPA